MYRDPGHGMRTKVVFDSRLLGTTVSRTPVSAIGEWLFSTAHPLGPAGDDYGAPAPEHPRHSLSSHPSPIPSAPAVTEDYHDSLRHPPDLAARQKRHPWKRPRHRIHQLKSDCGLFYQLRQCVPEFSSNIAASIKCREETRDASARTAPGGKRRYLTTPMTARNAKPARGFARRDGAPLAAATAAWLCEGPAVEGTRASMARHARPPLPSDSGM
ncbi:Uncharacterized protein TPAR_04088 [Tolypocladium paradoxum]|uniref:Uncharacterized protein n=1 Tax=Tolypocladium paradoxum TaxID=94208 RepID=A0A2S4KZY2_9HYPO|nr:Uncharacterized protein TPAR_04088 [Tolypocladium paradoxum]